jgi:hypothetical protein
VAELPGHDRVAALPALRASVSAVPDVVAVTQPRIAPSGRVAVMQVYPASAPQSSASTNLVNRLRDDVLPPLERSARTPVLVGGFTAGQIDFSRVLSSKLPLFIGLVVLLGPRPGQSRPETVGCCVEVASDDAERSALVHIGLPTRQLFESWIEDAAARGIRLISYDRPGPEDRRPRRSPSLE